MKQSQFQDSFPKAPDSFHQRVQQTLNGLPERKVIPMTSRNVLKKVLIAAATVAVLATAIFAGTRAIMTTSHSNRANDFTEFPTQQQLVKNYGFAPKLVEQFSNGYAFERGTPISSSSTNEDGREVEAYTDVHLVYTLGLEKVELYANTSSMLLHNPLATVLEQDGVTFYYTAHTMKFVPVDYELTAQDQLDEASGALSFSYGTETVQIKQVQSLDWTLDGINYELLAMDTSLAQSELMAMAAELVAQP